MDQITLNLALQMAKERDAALTGGFDDRILESKPGSSRRDQPRLPRPNATIVARAAGRLRHKPAAAV